MAEQNWHNAWVTDEEHKWIKTVPMLVWVTHCHSSKQAPRTPLREFKTKLRCLKDLKCLFYDYTLEKETRLGWLVIVKSLWGWNKPSKKKKKKKVLGIFEMSTDVFLFFSRNRFSKWHFNYAALWLNNGLMVRQESWIIWSLMYCCWTDAGWRLGRLPLVWMLCVHICLCEDSNGVQTTHTNTHAAQSENTECKLEHVHQYIAKYRTQYISGVRQYQLC